MQVWENLVFDVVTAIMYKHSLALLHNLYYFVKNKAKTWI